MKKDWVVDKGYSFVLRTEMCRKLLKSENFEIGCML